jgi:hypothetical protein
LDEASQAAERLIAEAAGEAASRLGARQGQDPRAPGTGNPGDPQEPSGAGAERPATRPPPDPDEPVKGAPPGPDEPVKPPPAGWQIPPADAQRPGSSADVDVLVQLLRSVRDLIPPELQRRLAAALREVLLALRALIDWYLERLEQQREKPAEVEDIPIL